VTPPPPNTTRRETLIAIASGVAVLGLLIYGVMTMGRTQQKASTNTLTGKVVGRKFTPLKEDQIRVGRGGLRGESLDGEYVLMVHVKSEDRTFEVPVDAATYEAVRDGGSFSFLRPRSEQAK
jgi:hypothetical protein